MPYSYNVYTGNGSTTQFAIGFPYIRREHVKVYVAYVDTAYTYVNNTTVQLATAPGAGVRVEVRRVTPVASVLVDFADGSTLVAADLDTSNLQHLYIEQELDDYSKQTISIDPATGLLTASGQRITNVAAPVNAQDAATKAYTDTQDALRLKRDGTQAMTGALPMGGFKVTGAADPTSAQDLATKTYVDTTTVASAGDTMSGNLAMGGNKVTGLGTTSASTDAATKQYVDDNALLYSGSPGFTQDGTGAVTRSWSSKLKDVVSIKDFGAKGDGVTDDGAAFLAASTALQAGQSLYIPAGRYILNTANNSAAYIANSYSYIAVIQKNGVSILGDSPASTVIELTGTGYPCPIYFENSNNCSVEGIKFIGNNQAPNSTSQTGNALWFYYGAGASAYAGKIAVRNCHFEEFKGSNWLAVYSGASVDVSDVLFTELRCSKGSDRNPASLNFAADQITVRAQGTGYVKHVAINNCICYADSVKKGIALSGLLKQVAIESCQVYNAGLNNPNQAVGRYGILIYAGAQTVIVSNCIVSNGQDTNIYLLNCADTLVTGCALSGHVNTVATDENDKGALVLAGTSGGVTNCIFKNNIINIVCDPSGEGATVLVSACTFVGGRSWVRNAQKTSSFPTSTDVHGGGFFNCKFHNSSLILRGTASPDRFYYGFTLEANQFFSGPSVPGGNAEVVMFAASDNGAQFRRLRIIGNLFKNYSGSVCSRAVSGQGGVLFDEGLSIVGNTFDGTFSEYTVALYSTSNVLVKDNVFRDCNPTPSGDLGYIWYSISITGRSSGNQYIDCNANRILVKAGDESFGYTVPSWTGAPGDFVQYVDNSNVYNNTDGFAWDAALQKWARAIGARSGRSTTSSAEVEVSLPRSTDAYLVGGRCGYSVYSVQYSGILLINEYLLSSVPRIKIELIDMAKSSVVGDFWTDPYTVTFDYYASTTAAYTGSFASSAILNQSTQGRPTKIKFRFNGWTSGPAINDTEVTLTPISTGPFRP